jgi:uncharacterized protein (TIRG00374 family)
MSGTGLFLFFFLRALDFQDFANAITEANYVFILPAVPVYFVAVWFRSLRWHVFLRPIRSIRVLRLYPTVVIGYMANNVLPLRVGDFFRAYLLGEQERISKSSTLATIALERMFDTLNLVLLAFAVSAFTPIPTWLRGTLLVLSVVLGSVILGAFLVILSPRLTERVVGLVTRPIPQRFRPRAQALIHEFLQGLDSVKRPDQWVVIIVLSSFIWFTEAGVYYLVALSFDDLALSENKLWLGVLLAVAASNLLTAAPSSSGGVGPFEFGVHRTLLQFKVPDAAAAAYAIVLHAVLLIPVVLFGLLFLWLFHISWRTIPSKAGEAVAAEASVGLAAPGKDGQQ